MDFAHHRQSLKHLKTTKGREAESVQMHGETSDHGIKDKHAKIKSETTDDHSSCTDSSRESGSSSDSEGKIDVVSRIDESNKNNHSQTHINGTKSMSSSDKKSSSSSSLESSSDDLFGIEKAFKYSRCDESILASKYSKCDESILASKSGKDYVSRSESFDKSEVDNSLLDPLPTYDVYSLSHSQKGMSPTASPPVQVMHRSGRHEASSIPSWVLDGNTNNQSEWSIASNDSLFSIQLGQPSFSREMALTCGELGLSEELTKSCESNSQGLSVIEDEIDTTIKSVVENLQTTHGSFKIEGEGVNESYNEIKTLQQTTSNKSSKSTVSSLSDSSETGMCPVNIPLKKKKRSRRWCGYECSKMFCRFWPSSSCSDSCGAFSCCWNSNHTKYRPHTSPILTEAERSDSTKIDIPQQKLEIQESEVTSNSIGSFCSCFGSKKESEATSKSSDGYCNWFHCFACPSCTWTLSCTCCLCFH